MVISEATFRKILRLSKHIKTYGKQNIKTACCSRCSEHSYFQRTFEIYGPEDFKACLEEDDLATFLDFPTLENRSVLQAYVKMVVVTLSVGVLATPDGTSVQEAIFILFLKVCEIIFFKTCFKIFLNEDFECLLKITVLTTLPATRRL